MLMNNISFTRTLKQGHTGFTHLLKAIEKKKKKSVRDQYVFKIQKYVTSVYALALLHDLYLLPIFSQDEFD